MSGPRHLVVAYLRDGVPGLPIADQEAVLRQAGVDFTQAYRDTLNPTQLRRREPGSLRQRARLLDPDAPLFSSPESLPLVIHVAALRCLGWNVGDVARALAAASRTGASVYAHDLGETFTAGQLRTRLLEALAAIDDTWRRGQTQEGRSAAAVVIAAKAEDARRAKLDAARPLWAKPSTEISGVEIAQQVGLSLRSLNKWLGPRRRARTAA